MCFVNHSRRKRFTWGFEFIPPPLARLFAESKTDPRSLDWYPAGRIRACRNGSWMCLVKFTEDGVVPGVSLMKPFRARMLAIPL